MRTSGAALLVPGFLALFTASALLDTSGRSLAGPQNTSLKVDELNPSEHSLEARRIPTGRGSRGLGGGKGFMVKRQDETSGNEPAEWEGKEVEANESNLNKHSLETKHIPTGKGFEGCVVKPKGREGGNTGPGKKAKKGGMKSQSGK